MVKIILSEEEKQILRNYFKTTPLILIRLKSQTVLLRSKGMKVADIADCLGRDSRTIARWIRDFKEIRLASMFTQQKGNQHASKLTLTQKEEIKLVLNHKPSDFGLPKDFWDVPQLKTYLYANFGVVYESDRSYHFLLEFGHLSFKEPDKFRIERNEKLIAQRMEEIYQEVIPLLEDSNCEVFYSDETRILFQALTRRAWLKKGEKTVIKVEKKDQYQNYLGFLNQRTFRCHRYDAELQTLLTDSFQTISI